ncbi:MAG: chemotaxis protein CheX [Treponema sp.]|nr:chemotaxis protein CheX [Treponema sp.]
MDAKVINAFLTAGMNTFQSMFGIKAQPKDAHLLDLRSGHPWDISGILCIRGNCHGIVIFRLHKILAGKMLQMSGVNCKPNEFVDMEKELVKEFTNIISGNAITELKDTYLDITPPTVVTGHNHEINWSKNLPVIAIPFSTEKGPFEVDVSFY